MRDKLSCFCLFSVLSFSALSWSQSYTGSIRGTITDPSQAAVPNAKVTVTDVDRNVEYRSLQVAAKFYY